MRGPPSIAVVIPAYNAAKTLDRTLNSAVDALRFCRSQIPDVEGEIIVVDDRSPDATPEIVKGWTARDPAVRLVSNPENRGPGYSRNEGVRKSTGTFLFFLDADDVFYPNHIHVCLAALLADDALGYVFTRMKIDMPMHADWPPSLDESCPINFCVRRIWHDMIQGFAEEADFRTYRTEDTLYRLCLRDLVRHRKLEIETCEQFVSPGNALDRQRQKLSMSMKAWNTSGLDDGFVLTAQMEAVVKTRLAHVAKLRGAKT
jgi:glycosyltransferase involved in cell wall biosynthesis